ncbi:ATP-dependent protease [Parashewanella spongiae]|uniref:endopeptidase La n=1 Tax=Parashewanella spongiae TaxID=342950 RepID=A0A3A6TXN2_9GAMM|nr:S16 family serine protease [Parashewanella spongiae]MCL1076875.1 AAA family ATPase [Parashewanella spongiae]RJY19242.1 ATP-dependent protease [Parashewanella spongiae]
MNPKLIPASELTPKYNIPTGFRAKCDKRHLLLGQERVVEAFQLSQQLPSQHLYIADFTGIERNLFIDALISLSNDKEPQFLAAAKADSAEIDLQWHKHPAPKNVGVIAEKSNSFCYLSGNIRRIDLLGKTIVNDKISEYKNGAFAENHTVFISIESLLEKEGIWSLLIDTLDTGYYRVSSTLEQVPLNCKIVLVGPIGLYNHLRIQDERFNRHFPLLGEVNNEVDLLAYPESDYALWLDALAESLSVKLSKSALEALFTYSSSLVEHQQRLSLASSELVQVLAQIKALSSSTTIDQIDVIKTLEFKKRRHNLSEVYSAQNFDDKFITLPTDGGMVGQVNGLTVIDTGDYSYGEPARITCTTHYGDGEVADIERKSELGGNIHAKGMMILSSCLYRIFGRDAPLHLNANIVFEQSYQEIDGDSASVAEFCCLLSAISESPILQNIAVTGALDQFGNVQAIGGVNEKITGFFNLCNRRKLTGSQGVIIPKANVKQINLPTEIVDAVKNGLFSLFQVDHVDQVIEILMQQPAGVADEDNDFPEKTLYGQVQKRLNELAGEFEAEPTLFERLVTMLKLNRD